MPQLYERQQYADQTIEAFRDAQFQWGKRDCACLASQHLENAGIASPLRNARRYRTAKGAMRALKALGFASLQDAMDSILERTPPAYALVGDIVGWDSGYEEMPALGVYLGANRVLLFSRPVGADKDIACIGPLGPTLFAWRLG